jgi:hypothetical protein
MEEMLLEDILNHINCQQGDRNEMTGAELEEWCSWFDCADEPQFGDCFEILKQC